MKNVLKSCAIQKTNPENYGAIKAADILRYSAKTEDSKADYAFIYYQNNSQDKIFTEKFSFAELKNTKVMTTIGL